MVLKSRTGRYGLVCLVLFLGMQLKQWKGARDEEAAIAAYRASHSTSTSSSPLPSPSPTTMPSGQLDPSVLLDEQAKTQQLLDEMARIVNGPPSAALAAKTPASIAAPLDAEAAYRTAHSTSSSPPPQPNSALSPPAPSPPAMTPPPVRTAFTTGSTGGTADCDGHPVALGLKPLITLATTMRHARDDDFKRKIQQNVLRGFMAQTPLDAVHPIVFTDQPELAAEVRQETSKIHGDSLETVESNFEAVHGYPTLRSMMKKAEAAAIKVGAPFYGYANGDILFTEDLIMTLRLLREGIDDGFFRRGEAKQGTPSSLIEKRCATGSGSGGGSSWLHTHAHPHLCVHPPRSLWICNLLHTVEHQAGLCPSLGCVTRRHPLLQQGMMIIGRRTNFPFSDYVEHLDHENR